MHALKLVTDGTAPHISWPQPSPRPSISRPDFRPPLGQILTEHQSVHPENLLKALAMKARQDCTLSDILRANNWVSEADLIAALEEQWNCQHIDVTTSAPDPRLVEQAGVEFCLKNGVLPWRRMPGGVVIVTTRPDQFKALEARLSDKFGRIFMALGQEADVHSALLSLDQTALAQKAEQRVSAKESCRTWKPIRFRVALAVVAMISLFGMFTAPALTFGVFCGWAVFTLLISTVLKMIAAVFHYQSRTTRIDPSAALQAGATTPARLPKVSILVPLFKEKDITEHLVQRLERLDYPKELLEICLVVEADDHTTRDAIAKAKLPFWLRAITVPEGQLRTKPRALNFAMDFCSGSIIGIYDAEDAPARDQIHKIVRRFHERGPEVACLQGVLDYYNARTNWLSRCFTIEYASWFRVVLPGFIRMGFAIPLGGTTLFFRRSALEQLGRWDAHNVTEDADLGIRLARHGYRAELVETVTEEEANCRMVPWVKQRSRWLKGYAITWAVHMRDPALLLRQLGPWKFFGVQMLFLGTLSQFVLAPLLWSFWMIPLGIWHPLVGVMPTTGFYILGGVFLLSEIVTITLGVLAVSGPKHRFLRWWVPSLHFYFPLGALASYKGLYELISQPFYWDKTSHGHFTPTSDTPEQVEALAE